jgi:hypothetical protein
MKMQEKSEQFVKLLGKIRLHDWIERKHISFNQTETALILEVLERRERELENHKKWYAANSERLKKKSSARYYANKTKICEQKKQKRVMGAFKAYG